MNAEKKRPPPQFVFLLLMALIFMVYLFLEGSSTTLVKDSGFEVIEHHCLRCHSAKLIEQSKRSKGEWLRVIEWMEKFHGMAPLSIEEKDLILKYLSKNYGSERQ